MSAGDFLSKAGTIQHLAMLLGMSQNGSQFGDNATGMLMSRGLAGSGPILHGAMGMMGLDPVSLGLRAATSVWGRGGGLVGASAAGLAVGLPMAAAGVGVQYAGQQMALGAQQQLALNQSLGQNFNFMNASGGTGFSAQQGYQIGNHLRDMQHNFTGPAGELTSFSELSKLAANMGRMGMAQEVKSVREFKDKFKEMTEALKVIAKDLGTSMEEAQKFMSSMRGSGIFQKSDQLRMSQGMRMTGLASGVAMSEISGMANIGSQISRAVGGTGRSGAFAGMETIGQVGLAQRTGAISEEDIYNATGLTGAEGRQALATSQLQQSASFLRSGPGRIFLASIADRNGKVNEQAVSEWMAGGMTKSRTWEMAHEGAYNRAGRANFIRNEGRLRGAALEKFGGMLQTMAYSQWLASSGYNPDTMDDTSMLAFQRFSGMGRDEADVAIKQIQALPKMLEEKRDTERNIGYHDAITAHKNTSGMQGMIRKAEHIRESIQSKLQQTGARIMQEGSNYLESWFNKQMGIYQSGVTDGLREIERGIRLGGPGAAEQYSRYFGGKGSLPSTGGGALSGALESITKQQHLSTLQLSAAVGSGSDEDTKFGKANDLLIREVSLAGANGSVRKTLSMLEAKLKEQDTPEAKALLKRLNFRGTPAGMLEGDMNDFMDWRYNGAMGGDLNNQVGILQSLQQGAGMASNLTASSQIGQSAAEVQFGNIGSYRTEADKLEALGRLVKTNGGAKEKGDDESWQKRWGKRALAAVSGPAGLMAAQVGTVMHFGEKLYNKISGSLDDTTLASKGFDAINGAVDSLMSGNDSSSSRNRAFARVFQDRDTMADLSDLNSGKADQEANAQRSIMDRLGQLRQFGSFDQMGADKQESVRALSAALVAKRYGKDFDKPMVLENALKMYAQHSGEQVSSYSDVMERIQMLKGFHAYGTDTLRQQQFINLNDSINSNASAIRYDQDRARRMGFVGGAGDDGMKSIALGFAPFGAATGKGFGFNKQTEEATTGMSDTAKAAVKLGLSLSSFDIANPSEEALRDAGFSKEWLDKQSGAVQGAAKAQAGNWAYMKKHGELTQQMGKLSLDEKRKIASKMAGTLPGDIAGSEAATESSYIASTKRMGKAGTLAKSLGLSLDDDFLTGLRGISDEQGIRAVMEKAGLGADKTLVTNVLEKMTKGTTGEQATGLKAVLANMGDANAKKLKEKQADLASPEVKALTTIAKNSESLPEILKAINTGFKNKDTPPPAENRQTSAATQPGGGNQ